jgi:hypothetical protein
LGPEKRGNIMNKIKGMKYYFIAATIALLAVFVAVPAGAWDLNGKLRGDYSYNLAANCTTAPCLCEDEVTYDCGECPAFNPDFTLTVPESQKYGSYNLAALITFNGHKNFTFKGEGLFINFPSDLPVNPFELNCDGTYKVVSEKNGLFVEISFNDCTSVVTSGLYKDLTQKVSGQLTARGRLDTATGTISVNLSNIGPEMVELDVIWPPYLPIKEQRICNYTGSMVKLLPWKH